MERSVVVLVVKWHLVEPWHKDFVRCLGASKGPQKDGSPFISLSNSKKGLQKGQTYMGVNSPLKVGHNEQGLIANGHSGFGSPVVQV